MRGPRQRVTLAHTRVTTWGLTVLTQKQRLSSQTTLPSTLGSCTSQLSHFCATPTCAGARTVRRAGSTYFRNRSLGRLMRGKRLSEGSQIYWLAWCRNLTVLISEEREKAPNYTLQQSGGRTA